jgi:hypothetical protein
VELVDRASSVARFVRIEYRRAVQPATRERLSDILAIGAFVVASGVLIDAGVVCSNDGSHYAIVRAIGDTGSFVIDPVRLVHVGRRHLDVRRRVLQ